jgi:hypothetical protein
LIGVFRLYKREQSVFTFDDYAVLLTEAKRVNAMRVLEFGPGNSTLAWIEAGCDEIVSLEHNQKWMAVAKDKLSGMHPDLRLLSYKNAPEIEVSGLSGTFDLAFVDSPPGVDLKSGTRFPGQENCSRFNTLSFALKCAPVVLLHDAKRPGEQETLKRIRDYGSYDIQIIDTVKGIARITPNGYVGKNEMDS